MVGARMATEMGEQPAVLRALGERRDEIRGLLRHTAPDPLRGIVLVARGSSDNAAVHGRYVLEAAAAVPVALAAPSLQTRYGVRPRLEGFLAIGVSQSGSTPEIVSTLRRLGDGGAATIAMTNVAGSSLTEGSDATLLLGAGDELAVPATKTFTAQAAALSLVADGLATVPLWSHSGWDRAVEAVCDALASPGEVERLVEPVMEAGRVLTVGRGFLYGAALEVALKLAETTGSTVTGISPADLRHGPIATVGAGTQAICLTAPGPVAADVGHVANELVSRGARVAAITADADLIPAADPVVSVLAGVPEALAVLVHAVRGQQLALATGAALGIDPDAPFDLSKVTRTT